MGLANRFWNALLDRLEAFGNAIWWFANTRWGRPFTALLIALLLIFILHFRWGWDVQ